QVHEYNEDFYILRESGCINAEKPFLYLIFGEDKALLEDTGVAYATPDHTVIPTAPVIMDLLDRWAKRKNHAPVSLVVIHSHSHGDHTAADDQFKSLPKNHRTLTLQARPHTDFRLAAGTAAHLNSRTARKMDRKPNYECTR